MNIFEFSGYVEEQPEFAELPLNEKLRMRGDLLQEIQMTQDYQMFSGDQRKEFDSMFITKEVPGLGPESLLGNTPEDVKGSEYLAQARAIRETGKSPMSMGDGFFEKFSNYLTGKVAVGIEGLMTDEGVFFGSPEAAFGDKVDEYKQYRDFVADNIDPEGMGTYKAGKVLGNVTGFVSDAYGASKLYGSVNAPGLLTKAFGGFTTQAGQSVGRKALAYAGQAAFETLGFVGETALADVITGEIDSNTRFKDYAQTLPNTMAQGVAYFALGEALGAGAAQGLKATSKVFTPGGFQNMRYGKLDRMGVHDLAEDMLDIIDGTKSEVDVLKGLRSSGATNEYLKEFSERARDMRILRDDTTLMNDPAKLQQQLFKILYKVEYTPKGDGFYVTKINGKELSAPKVIDSMDGMRDLMVDSRIAFENSIFEDTAKFISNRSADVSVKVTGKQFDKAFKLKPKQFNELFRPANFEVPVKPVEDILKSLDPDGNFKIQSIDNYFATPRVPDPGTIVIPREVLTGRQSEKFVKDLFKQLETVNPGIRYNSKQLQSLLRGSTNIQYDRKFLDLVYPKGDINVKPAGDVEIRGLDGEITSFKSVDEAGRSGHMNQYPDGKLNISLAKNNGISIARRKQGYDLIGVDDGKIVDHVTSIQQIFDNPAYRPPLPYTSRTVFSGFVDTGKTSPVTTLLKAGKLSDAVDSLAKYADSGSFEPERFITETGVVRAKPTTRQFEVEFKDSGIKNTFETFEEAEAFLKKDLKTYEDLEKLARSKGHRLEPRKGGYTIFSEGVEPQYARNLDEVGKKIGDLDSVSNMRDLVDDFDPAIVEAVKTRTANEAVPIMEKKHTDIFGKRTANKGYRANLAKRFFDKHWVPIRQRFEQFGDLPALEEVTKLLDQNKIYHSVYGQSKQRLHSLFHGKGRNFKAHELRNMGELLREEMTKGDTIAYAKDRGIELTQPMMETLDEVRSIFDALGKRFGIDPTKWVDQYFPRLKEVSSNNFEAVNKIDVMQAAMGDISTADIKPWFEHFRTEDFISSRFDNNIEAVLDTYMRVGLRKEILGETVERVNKGIKDGIFDDEASKLLNKTVHQVSGKVYSSERAEEVAERVLTNKARADEILAAEGKYARLTEDQRYTKAQNMMHNDYSRFAGDLVTSSLMAYKMKMPLRNVAQIWNIGATMMGSEYIARGAKAIGDTDTAVALYRELVSLGIIKPRDVKAVSGPALQRFIKEVNRVGLNNFYHSDDFTRLVSSQAMRELFADGYSLYAKGDIDLEGFLKFTKADWFNEVDQTNIIRLMKEGNLKSAEALAMRRATDMTMFDYDLTNRPEAMTSGLAKLWGKFGTYPSQYLQFFKRGMEKEGAWFLAKSTAATASIGIMYSDLLNISGMSMTPWNTMMFTGSPVMSSGISLMNDVSDGNFSAESLARDLSVAVPFYGIAAHTIKGFEEIAEGQHFDGAVRFLGATPQGDEKQFDAFVDIGENILGLF